MRVARLEMMNKEEGKGKSNDVADAWAERKVRRPTTMLSVARSKAVEVG